MYVYIYIYICIERERYKYHSSFQGTQGPGDALGLAPSDAQLHRCGSHVTITQYTILHYN